MAKLLLSVSIVLVGLLSQAQQNALTPETASEIILEKMIRRTEPVQYSQDSVGSIVIRKLFYDKANHPDPVSKKEYLENFYLTSYARENLCNLIGRLENPEFRRDVYSLTSSDSLLLHGRNQLWWLTPVDTSIATNPYYQFFSFNLVRDGLCTANRFVPSGCAYGGQSPVAKPNALIYDSRFTIGVPRVSIYDSLNNRADLPFILLGRDFVSYKSNLMLLANVIKFTGLPDSTVQMLIVQLDAYADFMPKNITSVTHNKNTCFRFHSHWLKADYYASLSSDYFINYSLVEEPQNLIPHVTTVFLVNYPYTYPEVVFKSKKRRKFIYEISLHNGQTFTATYKRNKVSIQEKRATKL